MEVGGSREERIQLHLWKSATIEVCVQYFNPIWTKLSVLQGLNSDNFWSFSIFISVKTIQAKDFWST